MTHNDTDISDEDLMGLIVKGNHQAFAELVNRHTQRFFNTAYRYVPHIQTSEDIVQDAFVKLWLKREKWDPSRGAKFTTWFTRIVTNQALDYLRRNKPEYGSENLEIYADAQIGADEMIVQSEQQEALENAIEALPERQKTALNLCTYEGVSNKEAADIMEIGVKALESLLMRAKSGIKAHLLRDGILKEKGENVDFKAGQVR